MQFWTVKIQIVKRASNNPPLFVQYLFFCLPSEPFTPTGNFEVDFSVLCTRAGFPSIQVVPRPHRPPTPNFIPQDSTPIGKQDKKDGKYLVEITIKPLDELSLHRLPIPINVLNV